MVHDNADSTVQLDTHPDDSLLTNVQPAPSTGFIALPAETVHHILRFLDPQDLIRVQGVSKGFHAIASGPTVWRTAYATAQLPLPPGPFPWQSTRFLQRTLVASARLGHTWTTARPTFLSSRTYTGPRAIEDDRYRWVRGRWLIMSKDMRQLRARDVETGAEQLLWNHGPYSNWSATSVMTALAHFMYLAVHLGRGRLEDPVKLLEFVVDDDTGELSFSEMMDVPTWSLAREAFTPCIRADSGIAPYVYISLCVTNPRHSLVFDPRSREFYKFPRFQSQLDILLNYRGKWLPRLVEVYFTRTHLFVFSRSYLIHGNVGDIELIQTFALPHVDPTAHRPKSDSVTNTSGGGGDASRPVVRELRLTHEMYTRQKGYTWDVSEPLRDAIVDPVTGSITLRFMHTYSPFYTSPDMHVRLVCAEYILPAYPGGNTCPTPIVVPAPAPGESNTNPPHTMKTTTPELEAFHTVVRSADPVLPITFRSHVIASIQGQWRGSLIHVSADGFIRGLCLLGWYTPTVGTQGLTGALEVVHKFTVDATGERCVAVVGDPCPSPPWAGFDLIRHYEYSLDAMRGKIWYTRGHVPEGDGQGRIIDRDTLAIVVDFQ